jgi:hypothetical protein
MSVEECSDGTTPPRPTGAHAEGLGDGATSGSVSGVDPGNGATSARTAPAPDAGNAPAAGGTGSAAAALAALTAAVDALAVAADPTSPGGRLEGAAAVDVVREALGLAGRLSAIAARVVPVVEADGWWALDGARSITTWVAAQGRSRMGRPRGWCRWAGRFATPCPPPRR